MNKYPIQELDGVRFTYIDVDCNRDPKTDWFCYRCQRDLTEGARFIFIHAFDIKGMTGWYAAHKEDIDKLSDKFISHGLVPVGLECARYIGKDFIMGSTD